jgi:transposase InsO family protein
MSDTFQAEMRFLGIESSPAFVRAPEGNGCAERFIRTLKETLLWIRTFDTVEDLRLALLEFRDIYNIAACSGMASPACPTSRATDG